ncbi:MAG: HAMP domain-containing sensor histidine kinase, partial [Perlucidibaca sp.]
HELRTPLTSIIGALDLLRSGAFGRMPETASPLLDMATGNSDRLHRLINDLLDTNRLMQDNLQLDMRVTDAVGIVRDVAASLMPMALKDGMHLTLQVPERQMVMADGERLAQVLVNLMANAIRFSRPGGEVIVRMAPEGGQVRFSVQDFGQGIDPSFASKAFTRFGQADASDTRSQGGTGLGLFICKGLVERMGGRIGYDSRPGEGATFWFSLPGGADDGAGV